MNYSRGDIILADLTFTNLGGSKVRPALGDPRPRRGGGWLGRGGCLESLLHYHSVRGLGSGTLTQSRDSARRVHSRWVPPRLSVSRTPQRRRWLGRKASHQHDLTFDMRPSAYPVVGRQFDTPGELVL